MQPFKTSRFFSIHDPADHIFPIADLSIEITELGQNITGNEIDQLAIDGCGSNIHGNGVVAVGCITRLNVDDMGFPAGMNRSHQGCGNLEISLPEDIRNFLDYRKIHCQSVFAMFQLQKTNQTRHIRKIVMR